VGPSMRGGAAFLLSSLRLHPSLSTHACSTAAAAATPNALRYLASPSFQDKKKRALMERGGEIQTAMENAPSIQPSETKATAIEVSAHACGAYFMLCIETQHTHTHTHHITYTQIAYTHARQCASTHTCKYTLTA
jgi:hypothetical protein